MARKAVKQKSEMVIQKELEGRIQIIGKISDGELGFAVKRNLIKWWELRAWQEARGRK